MIIDAKDLIVGRMGTFVAKKALLGERVDIVNADLAVISGKKTQILANYRQKSTRGVPSKGPHYLRLSDRFLKRLIRNMLPYKQERGKEAFKRIMCWRGVPDKFKDQKFTVVETAKVSKLPNYNYIKIKDIVSYLGGKVE
ncbi:50S ribosomal protein L13 [Nanoarchaeota archaeon]